MGREEPAETRSRNFLSLRQLAANVAVSRSVVLICFFLGSPPVSNSNQGWQKVLEPADFKQNLSRPRCNLAGDLLASGTVVGQTGLRPAGLNQI